MINSQIKRILVYRIGQLGDIIVALPAMWAVRRCFPSAYMALLCDRHTKPGYVLAQEVLPPEGLFDEYLTYEANVKGTNPLSLIAVLPSLRQRQFDMLVYLAPRLRSRWKVWRDLFFFRLAGIRHFIGHKGFQPLPPRSSNGGLPKVEHEADHLLDRLAKSGLPVLASDYGRMDLKLTQTELAEAQTWLKLQVGHRHEGPLIGFGPGSKWPSKVWPLERYAALGQRLIDEFDAFPIVFGGPEDRELGERLIAHWRRGANAAGKLKVRQAAAVLSFCQLYVGNDTGTMHLAAAVGVTCVVAFSAQDWPGRWYPYGNQHFVLRRSVPCEGCMLSICKERGKICLMEISVEDMWQACRKALSEKYKSDKM